MILITKTIEALFLSLGKLKPLDFKNDSEQFHYVPKFCANYL